MKNYIKLISELILDWNTIQSKCANLQELATKSIDWSYNSYNKKIYL